MDKDKGFYDGKTQLKKAHLGLLICFISFFCCLFASFLGLKILSKILFYLTIPVIIYTWIIGFKIVIKGNKRAYQRLKNKETVLTDDLLDD